MSDLYEAMKNFLASIEVVCLRCGHCCWAWEVHGVPGYEKDIKPEDRACVHRIEVVMDDQGQWQIASCKIHNTAEYPKECSEFKAPSRFDDEPCPCLFGIGVWNARLEEYPNPKLPEWIERLLGLKQAEED